MIAMPDTGADLARALATFAEQPIDLLVIDGGDGTVRDVLTAAGEQWRGGLPPLAIVPSGRINALARDLGLPADWSLADALRAATLGRTRLRRPIEVMRHGAAMPVRGFLFGTGAAVGVLSSFRHAGAGGRATLFGRAMLTALWQGRRARACQGEPTRLCLPGHRPIGAAPYALIASTLVRPPFGARIFGRTRAGLKLLTIAAPPRWPVLALPALLAGSERRWLEAAGYHRHDTTAFDVDLADGYMLDGKRFPGGMLTVRQGAPIAFVVP